MRKNYKQSRSERMMMFEAEMEDGEVRYRIEQDARTGVVVATVTAAAFDAKDALKLASKLDDATIRDLAEGWEESKHEARAR